MASPQENKQLVHRHVEALDEQDWDRCADTPAVDFTFHQSGETHHGVDWYVDHLKDFYDDVPEASTTIDDAIAEDDRVAVRITNTGTLAGESPDSEATETEIGFASHIIARVEDDAIAELWVVAELLRVNRQLGAIEPPGSSSD